MKEKGEDSTLDFVPPSPSRPSDTLSYHEQQHRRRQAAAGGDASGVAVGSSGSGRVDGASVLLPSSAPAVRGGGGLTGGVGSGGGDGNGNGNNTSKKKKNKAAATRIGEVLTRLPLSKLKIVVGESSRVEGGSVACDSYTKKKEVKTSVKRERI